MNKVIVAVTAAVLALSLSSCVLPDVNSGHSLSSGTSSSSSYGSYQEPAPTTTSYTPPLPTPAQFRMDLTETSRDCFGDAGCNVSYRITPVYLGTGGVPKGSFTLVYAVYGGDDQQTGNIAVRNGKFQTETGFISTPSSGGELTAQVTQVLED